MSEKILTVHSDKISCTDDFVSTPDLAKVNLTEQALVEINARIKLVREAGFDQAVIWGFLPCGLFVEDAGLDIEECEVVFDDRAYEPFETGIHNCADLRLHNSGRVQCQIDIRHSAVAYTFDLGHINELNAAFSQVTGEGLKPKPAEVPEPVQECPVVQMPASVDALVAALQGAHRHLRKSGYDMTEIDKALAMAHQVSSKPPRVLVVVKDGMADTLCDPGVDVEVFDWYTIDHEGKEDACGVPPRFADLAKPCGIPIEGESA